MHHAGHSRAQSMHEVQFSSISAMTPRVRGGSSYLEVDQDGQPKRNVSGRIAENGARIELAARDELRIRAGNGGVVRLTINGIELGAMGRPGTVVEWRITRR